jgi:hypothetical protein
MTRLLSFLLLTAFSLSAHPLQSARLHAAQEPRNTTLCELAKDPAAYNHDSVRLTAFVTHGFEDFMLADPSCPTQLQHFSVWVMYGGKTQSNTAYCCPGEAGREIRSESLSVEGIEIPLLTDKTFQRFANLLRREPDTTVHATLVGTFFSGEKQTLSGSTYWRGFGHLGCCSLFALQRVEAFEPHTRSDLDFTSAGGWYEKEGCDYSGLRYLRYVSLSDAQSESQEAISEQSLADSGARAWAFDDPRRVAIESLRAFYQEQTLVLRSVKRTAAREVFQWKNGKNVVTVVVSKPYWLSFYAKSNSVAWLTTVIKVADCH